MAEISLSDFLKLYKTPGKTEDPAIHDVKALRRIVHDAGEAFPLIATNAVLTHIIKSEQDGDFHFYVETEQTLNDPNAPMATCEIQGLAIPVGNPDPRIPRFKQLAGEDVALTGLFRCWPEHLRDSTQPHLFEIHPVLSIGTANEAAIDFFDRVIWPTGEDEDEPSRTFNRAFGEPKQLAVKRNGNQIVLSTPSHGMKKENYIHVDAFCIGEVQLSGDWAIATLAEKADGQNPVLGLALKGTPAYADVKAMEDGQQYRVGGLGGLDIPALLDTPPRWQAQLCPLLSVDPL